MRLKGSQRDECPIVKELFAPLAPHIEGYMITVFIYKLNKEQFFVSNAVLRQDFDF